jgi:hypothetical protein
MYDIVPMPAFHTDNRPIPTAEYESRLNGAIVKVHFILTSWAFLRTKVKVWEIIVLMPPIPAVKLPMKKRDIRDGPVTSQSKESKNVLKCCAMIVKMFLMYVVQL